MNLIDDPSTGAVIAWSKCDNVPRLPYEDRRPLSVPLRTLLTAVCVAAVALGAFVIGDYATGSGGHPAAPPPATAPVQSR